MHALRDSLSKGYTILLTCPFLRENCVSAVVSKQFASKACSRPDLLAVIDKQWDIVRIATSASV